MDELLLLLDAGQRRGSKPRCHLLTHGPRDEVARRLSGLLNGVATVSEQDKWMPCGFEQLDEAQLHRTPNLFPQDRNLCNELHQWWIAVRRGRQTLPSFDIASTCQVGGKPGLLLVEAKAHVAELAMESGGKRLRAKCSDNSFQNHMKIGAAIAEAAAQLQRATGWPWAISRDSRYQMSNRFAWSWKIASMGVPVVLMYLGFLNACEMGVPFPSPEAWEEAVYQHASGFVPFHAWNRTIENTFTLHTCVRSIQLDLPQNAQGAR